jgi:enamidase
MAGKLVVRNVGLMLSGALENPILDADALIAEGGRIAAFGKEKDLNTAGADAVIDAKGSALCPGLIDSHVHPVAGDWTPRQSQMNWIDSSMHGGVTTMISAGEAHFPGRPKDPTGVVALAIAAQRSFSAWPGKVKMLAGAPILEKGMEEEHFKFMAEAGVKLLGEVGLGGVKAGDEAKQMVSWARKYGIQSTIHTGGPSIPGSGLIDKDVVLEAGADVIGHINGGHTSLPFDQIQCLCEECSAAIEIVHNGNPKAAVFALRVAKELGQLDRVILGTDGPAGSGVQPLGIIRMISFLSAMGDLPAEQAFCLATGNTARMRDLDCGLIEEGRAADLVFIDKPQHSAGKDLLEAVALGDIPGVGMVVINGEVASGRSRNTPPAERVPEMAG